MTTLTLNTTDINNIDTYKQQIQDAYLVINTLTSPDMSKDERKEINRQNKLIDKLTKKVERILCGHNLLIKVFNSVGVVVSKNGTKGYYFDKVNPNHITFNGLAFEEFNDITKLVTSRGFVIESMLEPINVAGFNSTSRMVVKPLI